MDELKGPDVGEDDVIVREYVYEYELVRVDGELVLLAVSEDAKRLADES